MTMLDIHSSIKPSENKKLPRYLVLDDRIIARSSDINSADLPALVRENEEKNRFIPINRDGTLQCETLMPYSYFEVVDKLREKIVASDPIPLKALELVSMGEFINLLKYFQC